MGRCLPVAPTILLFPNTRLASDCNCKNSVCFDAVIGSGRWGLLHQDNKQADFAFPEWQTPSGFYNHLKQSLGVIFLQLLFDSGLSHTHTLRNHLTASLFPSPPPSPLPLWFLVVKCISQCNLSVLYIQTHTSCILCRIMWFAKCLVCHV